MGWDALGHWGDDAARIERLAGGVANDVWSVRIAGHLAVGRLGTRSDADLTWETELLSIGEEALRCISALSLLITLVASANAATMHHAHRPHVVVRPSGFGYAPSGPPTQYRPAPDQGYNEPYFGAAQGYAPGEKERFLDSVRRGG